MHETYVFSNKDKLFHGRQKSHLQNLAFGDNKQDFGAQCSYKDSPSLDVIITLAPVILLFFAHPPPGYLKKMDAYRTN